MMIYYVTHAYDGKPETYEKVKQIVFDFQSDDWENCYVSPILTFPYIGTKDETGEPLNLVPVRLDLLTVCDVLLVASEPDDAVKMEIEFAKSVGMETYYV